MERYTDDPKRLVYDAAGSITLEYGRNLLRQAEEIGAKVTQLPPRELSRDQAYDGFHASVTFRIDLPSGEFTHIYWQPKRYSRHPEWEGNWYGRATQWSRPCA